MMFIKLVVNEYYKRYEEWMDMQYGSRECLSINNDDHLKVFHHKETTSFIKL